ncbi:hypothetical protein MMC10_007172 [Thelotrema lepadinum]|nr:hypothetical protein [Thelotrema lepadinum]
MSHRVEQRAGADGPVPLKQYGSLETRLARLRQLMYSNFLVPFNRGVSEARQHPKEDYEVSVREWNERYGETEPEPKLPKARKRKASAPERNRPRKRGTGSVPSEETKQANLFIATMPTRSLRIGTTVKYGDYIEVLRDRVGLYLLQQIIYSAKHFYKFTINPEQQHLKSLLVGTVS